MNRQPQSRPHTPSPESRDVSPPWQPAPGDLWTTSDDDSPGIAPMDEEVEQDQFKGVSPAAAALPVTPPRTRSPVSLASGGSLPSPMSLHHLGIMSPRSPLRRQFSSPLAFPSPGEDGVLADEEDVERHYAGDSSNDAADADAEPDDFAEDSKDVLVDRLNDLIRRLSGPGRGHVRDEDVTALHGRVDDMEEVLAGRRHHTTSSKAEAPPPPRRRRPPPSPLLSRPHSLALDGRRDEYDAPWGPPLPSPSWLLKSHFSEPPASAEGLGKESAKKDVLARTEVPPPPPNPEEEKNKQKLAASSEELAQELATVLKNMHERQQESAKLHALFLERFEMAAQRIAELEARVEELEDRSQDDESELSFLRLQLRSIEVQCLEYMPADADPELAQSIRNWKADWAGLRSRWAARKEGDGDGHGHGHGRDCTPGGGSGARPRPAFRTAASLPVPGR